MSFYYAVIGAGRQGTASAYDLAIYGEASQIFIKDVDAKKARSTAERVNWLVGHKVTTEIKLDVRNQGSVEKALKNMDACISAAPYSFNVKLTKAAIRTKTHIACPHLLYHL